MEANAFSFFFPVLFFSPALSPLSLQSELFALQSRETTLANSFDAVPLFFILQGEICTSFGTCRGEDGVYTEGFSSIRCHTDTLEGALF
uniref:Secreted protein n=1 Tax=Arundo donax TaxID=35708 RepID=A0A0A9DMC5_ARUDO